jgi:caa(3)-type oxidase subunit IV
MPPGFLRLLLGWIALLLLWGLEFGLSFVQMPPSVRPVILAVAAVMVALIAVFFMHVGSGPILVRGFAVVAVFWMIVLIGLGSMDPLTRTQYFTAIDHP